MSSSEVKGKYVKKTARFGAISAWTIKVTLLYGMWCWVHWHWCCRQQAPPRHQLLNLVMFQEMVKLLFVFTLMTKCKGKIKNRLQKSNVVVEISPSQNALKSWLLCWGEFIHVYFLSPNDICLESEILMLLCVV